MAVQKVVDSLLPTHDWPSIVWACIGLLVLYLISMGMQFVVNYWGHMLGINIETDMRQKLFNHLQKLSFRFFDNTKTGHLMSRMTNDLFELGELAHHGPEDLFIALMTFAGAFGIMMTVDWQLACITFVVVPLLVWIIVYFNRKLDYAASDMFASIADINARVEDSIGGIRVVKSFSNEAHEMERFSQNNAVFRSTKLRSYMTISFSSSGIYMLTRLISLIVLICGAWFAYQGRLTYGELIGFLLYVGIFLKPIDKINAFMESYPKGMAGFKRYCELMDTVPDVKDERRLGADNEDIVDAARRAHLESMILSLPHGYETIIGDRGLKLSGGQRQRLAIARMFLKNPPILILDEATSALDTETEAIIQQALAELAVNRTTLIIAHRLATIRHADRIVVVTEDGVAEQGRHDKLLAAGGVYARLHGAQFG
jgi:ABC-type multidrug transport system fused ATPase/permease subunit